MRAGEVAFASRCDDAIRHCFLYFVILKTHTYGFFFVCSHSSEPDLQQPVSRTPNQPLLLQEGPGWSTRLRTTVRFGIWTSVSANPPLPRFSRKYGIPCPLLRLENGVFPRFCSLAPRLTQHRLCIFTSAHGGFEDHALASK